MGFKRRLLIQVWKSTQVKLHGCYSADRVQNLAKYARETSWVHAIAITVATPLPCLIVTLLTDIMPLAVPSDGIEANRLLFVREYYAFMVMTCIALHQFRKGVQVLPYPTKQVVRDSIVISALSVGTLYGLVLLIGFPLPFMNLLAMPVWAALVATALAVQWKGRIRTTPRAKQMLIGTLKLWLCEFLLMFIYPPYFYVFTAISNFSGKMAFGLLLPLLKLLMRNLFSRAVCHLGDETLSIVVFHADVFGSLNVAYCMQSSPLLWMTLAIMAIDIVFTGLSLREIDVARKELEALERRLEAANHMNSSGRRLTSLERVSKLIQQEREQEMPQTSLLIGVYPEPLAMYKATTIRALAVTNTQVQQPIHAVPTAIGMKRIYPEFRQIGEPSTRLSLIYSLKLRQLLYMAEFALLLNYVESIIPLVFSIYLVATYHLPNRNYYPIYDNMEQHQLLETLVSVMLYCLLQLLSLVFVTVMLKRMIGHSPIQQIAFVLQHQVDWVQMCLVFWLFYNVQGSLRHLGYDYSFKFAWLSGSTSTVAN
ncbi:hypothetical protein PF001_g21528 [Phytophthora fragariae]|uniref:Uncharacterized protein n=5 Tax=Phytophthora fragariae TaxID=53985 RepID=A0A6A4CG63_9STRA|nr:hypothetical protein PF004_g21207 [Phytophthora fragariae]KAE9286255.1 hypothetical protein PF001_g21528 [Phytophthora fragariae]